MEFNVDFTLSFEETVIARAEDETDNGLEVFEDIFSLIFIIDFSLDVAGPL